jgi:hypothetical protein
MKRPYMQQLQELLHDMGGTHTYEDIHGLLDTGALQSFVEGDTWAVTSVIQFPQAAVMDIFFVVGELKDFDALEKRIETFAREIGVTFMRVYARKGFEYLMSRRSWTVGRSWRPGPRVFTKRLDLH